VKRLIAVCPRLAHHRPLIELTGSHLTLGVACACCTVPAALGLAESVRAEAGEFTADTGPPGWPACPAGPRGGPAWRCVR